MSSRLIHGVIEMGVQRTLCGRDVARCLVVYDPFDSTVTCRQCLRALEWS